MNLYPLKFEPIYKSKIWGGDRLKTILEKDVKGLEKVGESWEVSALPGEQSIVQDGWLKGLSIEVLIEKYQQQIVGKKVYEKFGKQFPLLLKFIDANEYLSIQVHPDDALAQKRHQSFGKTEMWYVVDAEPEAELIVGFNQNMDKEKYLKSMEEGNVKEVLNFEKVEPGDVFYLPAGRVHATGPGILFAEVQQMSDITYRIYDWDRVDGAGKGRELHTEQALDAMDFAPVKDYKTAYNKGRDQVNKIISNNFFTTNYLNLNEKLKLDYSAIDSFVAFMALDGEAEIFYNTKDSVSLKKGETLLIPAAIKSLVLSPTQEGIKLLEIFVKL